MRSNKGPVHQNLTFRPGDQTVSEGRRDVTWFFVYLLIVPVWRSWQRLCCSAETFLFISSPRSSPRPTWWGNTNASLVTSLVLRSADLCEVLTCSVCLFPAVRCEEARGSGRRDGHRLTQPQRRQWIQGDVMNEYTWLLQDRWQVSSSCFQIVSSIVVNTVSQEHSRSKCSRWLLNEPIKAHCVTLDVSDKIGHRCLTG